MIFSKLLLTKRSTLSAGMLAICLFTLTACTQPCTLSLEQSPELRGFRLGMTVEQIQKRFQGFPNPPANEFGLATVIIEKNITGEVRPSTGHSFVDASSYPDFEGVDRTYLKIVDGRVAEIEVYYANDLKWKSVDEFVSRTAETLKLNGSWEKKNDGYQSLSCSGFLVYAGIKRDHLRPDKYESLPYIELTDYMTAMNPMMREYNKNENTKHKEKERRDTFTP